MRGIGSILVVLIVAHLSSQQSAGAQEFPNERRRKVDRYLPWVATSLAVAGSGYFFVRMGWTAGEGESIFLADATDWKKIAVAVPGTVAFAATSYFMSRWFERSIMRRAGTWWGAGLWGLGIGIVSGAAIATSGWTVTFALGDPMGIVDTGSLGSYLSVIGMSILSGSLRGALLGVVPGVVLGPAIHLYTTD